MIELMPPPTIPKTWVAPQSISVSTRKRKNVIPPMHAGKTRPPGVLLDRHGIQMQHEVADTQQALADVALEAPRLGNEDDGGLDGLQGRLDVFQGGHADEICEVETKTIHIKGADEVDEAARMETSPLKFAYRLKQVPGLSVSLSCSELKHATRLRFVRACAVEAFNPRC